MKPRKQSTVWAAMLTGLTYGCAGTGGPAGTGPELADGQREVTPPRPGTLLERFSFRSPSGDAVSWDADRGTLVAGGALHERPVLFLHVFQPDCEKCRALARALEGEKQRSALGDVWVIGLAHRGDAQDAAAFAEATGVSYPIAVATGSDWARRWGRGDPLFVIDRAGKVAYSRVGFHEADPTVWRKVAADAAAERPVRERFAGRQQLHTGDRFPLIALPDLMHEGRTITLAAAGDGLVFRDHTGRVRDYRAAVGFFSRYWAFSREEMVHLQRFHEQYAKRGLFVFAIAMAPDPKTAQRITQRLGVTYPVFLGNGSDLGERYAYGWPAYIIDAGGVIRYTQLGFEAGDEKRYETIIRKLLASEEPASE